MIRTVTATRYIHPLREGGSVPAVVEADDGELYVMKFIGAAQGPKALIAELVAGEIARTVGLRLPEIVLIELDPVLGRSEPHPEIRDLIQASGGLNLALRYLPSAFAYNPLLQPPVNAELASAIVWFDAYVTNVDRTPRNVNMLLWQEELWLIDHGAALYFHHDWSDYLARSRSPFAFIRQHVLLPLASQVGAADERLRPLLTEERLRQIVDWIPAHWLGDEAQFAGPDEHRTAYLAYLTTRLAAAPETFVREAANAHAALV
ncbi:MAG: HipA family kinase [Caldilineaceae bacterium]